MTDVDDIKVIKRDGNKEAFDPQKIERIAAAAGLTEEESKKLRVDVTKFASKHAGENDGCISSLKIRSEVYERMVETNEYAAGLFKWFEKNKEEQEA